MLACIPARAPGIWTRCSAHHPRAATIPNFSRKSEEAAPSLTTVVTTDKSTHARNEAMRLFALVKNNGVVVQGVSVTFVITQPNGKTTQVTGTHTVKGTWSLSGKTSSGSTTFNVR